MTIYEAADSWDSTYEKELKAKRADARLGACVEFIDKTTPEEESIRLEWYSASLYSGHCDLEQAWKQVTQQLSKITATKVESAPQPQASQDAVELEGIFNGLAATWSNETGAYSITSKRYAHPSYQAILTLGKDAIPLILKQLREKPDMWFEALTALAKPKVNPVKPGDTFEEAINAWLKWGNDQKIL